MPVPVREYAHTGRLVRDDVPQPLGVPGEQVEGDDGAGAGAEDVRGVAGGEDAVEHPSGAVAPVLDALVVDGCAEPAVGQAERVVDDDGEPVGECLGQRTEPHGMARPAGDDQQHGTAAVDVVVEVGHSSSLSSRGQFCSRTCRASMARFQDFCTSRGAPKPPLASSAQ